MDTRNGEGRVSLQKRLFKGRVDKIYIDALIIWVQGGYVVWVGVPYIIMRREIGRQKRQVNQTCDWLGNKLSELLKIAADTKVYKWQKESHLLRLNLLKETCLSSVIFLFGSFTILI